MNQVYRDAAAAVQQGWVLGVMTVIFLACFLGWVVWAYLPRHKAAMDEAARLPLTEGDQQ